MLPAMLRIAISSCCRLWEDPEHHAFIEMVKEKPRPDWLLLLGDNVYLRKRQERKLSRGKVGVRSVLVPEFERLFGDASFRALVGMPGAETETRLLATWDDHDFGGNNLNGAEEPYRAFREESRKLFLEYLSGAGGPRSEIYCSLSPVPGVRIIITDARYYRTDPSAIEASILGQAQETWLLNELARPEALKIIASGSCLGPRAKKRYRQGWDRYPAWYRVFRNAVTRHHHAGKRHLFLAGDIHRNKIIDHTRTSAGCPVLEVISSGACRRRRDWLPGSSPLQNYGVLQVGASSIEIRLTGNLERDRWAVTVDTDSWTVGQRG
jgi:alkaline phosphatase D